MSDIDNKTADAIITNIQNDSQTAKFDNKDELVYTAGHEVGKSMTDIDTTKETNDDMIVGRVHKKEFASLKDDIEKIVANKIAQKINQKKQEFIDTVRGNL